MVDFKKVKAPNNTITRNPAVLAAKADNNIYEAVAIIAKRSNQIAVEMKEELSRKLQEFASYTDNLEEIFEKCPLRISIKTRIGKENPAEWERLLAIYEKYPLEELIVHPRVQTDFYKNRVNLEAFARAEKNSRHSLCYNGDIVDAASAAHIREGFPSVDKFMIGRGLIKHPWLLEELSGGRQEKQERKERFFRFHNAILEGYRQQMSGDKNTLFKMKELWAYWGENFADADQRLKKIRKCERVAEYECLVDALFREKELCV